MSGRPAKVIAAARSLQGHWVLAASARRLAAGAIELRTRRPGRVLREPLNAHLLEIIDAGSAIEASATG